MRFGSEVLRGLLTSSFDHYWEADLYYDGERRQERVPLTDVRPSEDAGAEIQQSMTCAVVWTDDFGRSVLPTAVEEPFAPFGAQLQVFSVVHSGPFVERVPYGWFLITDVPSARDEQMRFRGDWITVGSTVELELKELTAAIGEETFDVPTAPASLVSAWDEVGRISGMPIERAVPDAAITRSVMYEDEKIKALYELMDVILSAVPHMTADGALSARPKAWPDPVDRITREVLVDIGSMMSAGKVYNRVVVRANGADQAAVLAVAEITTGPLRVRNPAGGRSPFGARTHYLSSELVTTRAQAQKWANETLAQVSTLRTQVVPVVELFNPLRERGDVVLIERPTHWLIGRVVTINRGQATQSLTVEIGGTTTVADPEPLLLPGDSTFPGDGVFPGGDI
ncbi:hypothetical protein [Microbacterium sp.]|uniref:hypothetical protein n=1 Tax=Microbacterium sp. TaxID=51671 RepID=UPI0028B06E0C|nr:hypothetical protein [Microbacterium sp.]